MATPGGLQQMLENGSCSLALVSFLVSDACPPKTNLIVIQSSFLFLAF